MSRLQKLEVDWLIGCPEPPWCHPRSVPDALDGLARMVFRFRSFTPLPFLAATVVLCWRDHIFPGPGGETADAALDVAGVALGVIGSAVRFAAAGFEPAIRAQSKRFSPTALHTRGVYQLLRHPGYLGNALITSGLLLIVNRPLAYLLVGPFFVLEYWLIIRAEERALREKFPSDWERWAASRVALRVRT
jgi:protein-S-isoprenylcysteine O-methyltransferase Ste14